MTDSTHPEEFTDVNETVSKDWENETTPYGRVREVISTTYSPVSADTIAGDAQTSPKTARKHLNALADDGFVMTTAGEDGGTYYHRSSESLVVEQAADILTNISTDELVTRVSEMRERISDFQAEHEVESPEELTVERTRQTLSETAQDHEAVDSKTIQEWQTTRRNLVFANAALSIANAKRFVDSDSGSSGAGIPTQ